MNINHHILSLIIFIPLAGALLLALLPDRGKLPQTTALLTTLITFIATLHLPFNYARTTGAFRFVTDHLWIPTPAIHYHLGVDPLAMWLVVLTGFLAPLGVLASWRVPAISSRAKTFYVLFLLQQVAMLGLFCALDLFLYYAFFELSLVPITILIATFGRTANRRPAAIKYFIYNFLPSALLLVGILWIYTKTHTMQLPELAHLAAIHAIPGSARGMWLCSLAFLLAFAVKVPIFPLHGWLKDAIVEAPTAAVMVLAGKTGFYSILRFSFAIFPAQSHRIAPVLIALGAIGIVYGALIAITRKDMKELAAYSTLSHLSFITLGIFTFTIAGLDGGMLQILNHGISGGALFLLLGFLYERYHTYDMRDLGGLAQRLPWMTTAFVLTALSLIGLPMLNGFVGEFLILSGTLQSATRHHIVWTVLATTGVILSAAYMLILIQRVFYGHLTPTTEQPVPTYTAKPDLTPREHLALIPLFALIVVMGVASPLWTRSLDHNATDLTTQPIPAAFPTCPPASCRVSFTQTEAQPDTKPVFVDPTLKHAVDDRISGHQTPAPAAPEGRRY